MSQERMNIRRKIERIIRNNKRNPLMAFYDPFQGDPLEPIVMNSEKLWEPPTGSRIESVEEVQNRIASKIGTSIKETLGILSNTIKITIKNTSTETEIYYLLSSDWNETIILLMDSASSRVIIAVAGKQETLARIINEIINEFYSPEKGRDAILVADAKNPEIIKIFQDTTKKNIPNLKLKLAFDEG